MRGSVPSYSFYGPVQVYCQRLGDRILEARCQS